jgi:predicted helicase
LKNEFGQTLGDNNVHIIDPFCGTGTFIARLLQSGLISPAQLPYKYQNEIHANEIVLLAYYIAAINIEAVYHDIINTVRPELVERCAHGSTSSPRTAESEKVAYQPFKGICLTDTFQLYEKDDLVSQILVDNSARRTKQKALDIRVIIGNPPYSAGQESANDNNANVEYKSLDEKIRSTYAEHSKATNKNALYDSYIRAFRWASDRIKDCGVIGFISNASFLETGSFDGLRQCLANEFSSIYIFHLRGNARTSGELRRKEKDNVFGQGTRTPIAITIFVKNPNAKENGNIYLHDIGDYLTQTQKLEKISDLKSINGITAADGWFTVIPDQHGDWLKQRDDSFSEFISLGDKKDKNSVVVFENYSRGVATSRDAWCYNFSKTTLAQNMRSMIDFYNQEVDRYKFLCNELSKDNKPNVDDFINTNSTKISWSRGLKSDLGRLVKHNYGNTVLTTGLYRPFTKSFVYFNKYMNDMVYQMPRIFPNAEVTNRIICINAVGAQKAFSALMADHLPDLHLMQTGQCFPLKLYEPTFDPELPNGQTKQADLFGNDDTGQTVDVVEQVANQPSYTVKDGITDAGLAHFQAAYPFETLNKEDLFYYIYGLLHSEDYKTRYADNLTKELPRIPCVKQAADFWAFSKAGRALAEWHINYENIAPYPVTFDCGKTKLGDLKDADFYVIKMKFAKKDDKSTVIYNHHITLKDIPLAAYDYVVNGKPALEWVMERQGVSTHKDSGIVNDANDWAIETMRNPRYPLELFQRVITVSLETMKIVNDLPKLDIS